MYVSRLMLAIAFLSGLNPCPAALGQNLDSLVAHAIDFAHTRMANTVHSFGESLIYPRSTLPDGSWLAIDPGDWTSGFFPGCLWYMYELTGDTAFHACAERWTAGLEAQQFTTRTHDVGFIMFSSYGNAYRLAPGEHDRQVLLQSAASLSTRYNPIVGCIKSWDGTDWPFPVIIDNMMNLEILFWAAKNGGPVALRDMATSHALKTMVNHFRADGSTYHVVSYDTLTGAVLARETHQGYADESVWSRGQAWAIYGFTMACRETGDDRFLSRAQRAADYFIGHLPPDLIPYWDFLAPNIPNEPRDVSAAAVACSGLLELSGLSADSSARGRYLQTALDLLRRMCMPPYLSEGTSSMALLNHSVGNMPAGTEVDVSLIYADYYFEEALLRYKAITSPKRTGFTIATQPSGLTIGIDGVTYTSPQTLSWVIGSRHMLSAPSPQESPGTRRVFSFWSDRGGQAHEVGVTLPDTADTAYFTTGYQLTVKASPVPAGSVIVSPSSSDGYHAARSTVQITAVPAGENGFYAWSGDVTGSANPDTVLMTGPKSVTAMFTSVNGVGTGGPGIPATFVLLPNYPNPFNGTTIIRFGVPRQARVAINVYSPLGQEVAIVVDREEEPGYHEVTFDASRFASGVYYCRLKVSAPDARTGRNSSNGSDGVDLLRPLVLIK